tara:strand:+ start:345 stop:992 length:648 start_codon:yes stop_codon:yes gene_type:complete
MKVRFKMTYTIRNFITESNNIDTSFNDSIAEFKDNVTKNYKEIINDIFSKGLKKHIVKKSDGNIEFNLKSLVLDKSYGFLADKRFNNIRSYILKTHVLGKTKASANFKSYINNKFKIDKVYRIKGIFENGILINELPKKSNIKNTVKKSNVKNIDTSNTVKQFTTDNELRDFFLKLSNAIQNNLDQKRFKNKKITLDMFLDELTLIVEAKNQKAS